MVNTLTKIKAGTAGVVVVGVSILVYSLYQKFKDTNLLDLNLSNYDQQTFIETPQAPEVIDIEPVADYAAAIIATNDNNYAIAKLTETLNLQYSTLNQYVEEVNQLRARNSELEALIQTKIVEINPTAVQKNDLIFSIRVGSDLDNQINTLNTGLREIREQTETNRVAYLNELSSYNSWNNEAGTILLKLVSPAVYELARTNNYNKVQTKYDLWQTYINYSSTAETNLNNLRNQKETIECQIITLDNQIRLFYESEVLPLTQELQTNNTRIQTVETALNICQLNIDTLKADLAALGVNI